MTQAPDGRLVWNHSTHLPGLIPILEKLIEQPGIGTVTPGVIAQVRAHSPELRIKVSVPLRGGFKLIARKGKTVQEVFVLTELDQVHLEAAVAKAMQAVA
ncbi:MAG TPA: metal-binding protein [Leptolyngbyaceae cyanobacterium M65_K2018_010]|nr:metal-binding protein [Leptolyngbyaceae cyanobacterium M65_K2018_010]